MSEIICREDGARVVAAVQGEFGIYSAAQLRTELLHLLLANPQLDIDLGEVGEFDSSGVQILLVLKREAQRQNKELTFIHHSPSVREVLDLLNLVAELGDPLVIPSDGGRP